MAGGGHAHHREGVIITADADEGVDAIAAERTGKQFRRALGVEGAGVLQAEANAVEPGAARGRGTFEAARNRRREGAARRGDREALAPELERCEQLDEIEQV